MPQLLSATLNGGIDPGISGTGARASYAMISYNTSSNQGGYALFDSTWGNPVNYGEANNYNSYGASDLVYVSGGGVHTRFVTMFPNAIGTENSPSSNGTSQYINGINACGEVGNAMLDVFSDGTWTNPMRDSNTWANKHFINIETINSDHVDRRNVYLLSSGRLRCIDRIYGSYNYPKPNTQDFTISGLDVNMSGSASYNFSRKELTILNFNGANGNYQVITYQNVDFNKYPNPAVALARPEVVRVNSTVSLGSLWNSNNNESYYNLKPIVTNNGTVYVTVMFTSNSFTLYSFIRSGTSASTGSYITGLSLTTSYGREQSYPHYGQRQITSRDGTSVCTFCPYYYYGSGGAFYIIDKINNNYTSWVNSASSIAVQPMPYGDSGWTFVHAGNAYASNYTGGYVERTYMRSGSSIIQVGSTRYFGKFTAPNTTNYPGYTQTVDFPLLTGNPVGVKLAR